LLLAMTLSKPSITLLARPKKADFVAAGRHPCSAPGLSAAARRRGL
jgi:hypothetical protein